MKEWKVILATLVIFGAGVVTGGLLVHQTQRPAGRPVPFLGFTRPQPGSGQTGQFGQRTPPNEQRMEFLRHISRQLELSPEQREKIERIIRDSQQQTKKLWEPVAAKMNVELRKTDTLIREALTTDQKQKFDEMRARARETRPEKMNRPGGAVPPGGNRSPMRSEKRFVKPQPSDGQPTNLNPRPPGEPITPPAPPPDRPQ